MNLLRNTALALGVLAATASMAQAQAPGISKNEILIGTILDISGPIAAFGKQSRNGMQLRVEEIT